MAKKIICLFCLLFIFATKVFSEDISVAIAQYRLGIIEFERRNWKEAETHLYAVARDYPCTTQGSEALYYLGIAFYNDQEYDFANAAFTGYIKRNPNPDFFESAIRYKYDIACKFMSGEKCHYLGKRSLPKYASGWCLAQEIFDEISVSMPCHELAALSLYNKAEMLWEEGSYPESIDTYYLFIRRFPKHQLAPECYLAISDIYLDQCRSSIHNADLLALAEINMKRCQIDFPKEERICLIEENIRGMKELYAEHLYETGRYYERKDKPRAAVIYYQTIQSRFPDTYHATCAGKRLFSLSHYIPPPIPCDPDCIPPEMECAG